MPRLPRSIGYNFSDNHCGKYLTLGSEVSWSRWISNTQHIFSAPLSRVYKRHSLKWPTHIQAESDGLLIQMELNSHLSGVSCSGCSLRLVVKVNAHGDHSQASRTPYGSRAKTLDMCTFVFGHFRLKIQLDLAVRQMKSVIFPLLDLHSVQINKYKTACT